MPEDWFVIGVDPLRRHILVKCRLTKRTGIVPDPEFVELEKASVQNFEPYPWIEPERVRPHLIKAETLSMSRKTQKLSGVLRKSQPLTSRIE